MFIKPITARLRLRQWRASDRAAFAELNADPKVMAFYTAPLGRVESDALADRFQALIAARGWDFWAVEIQGSGAFAGFVGLHHPQPTLPFSPCVEIGWRLAARFWGRGLATEAARAALGVGFEQLGLPEVVAFTSLDNLKSRAVMARLGMREVPERFEHPGIPPGHRLREHCLYRLLRGQWPGNATTNTR